MHLADHPFSDRPEPPAGHGHRQRHARFLFGRRAARQHRVAALAHCEQLLKDGADILDIGGESTRPGSPAGDAGRRAGAGAAGGARARELGVPVSVDTYKPE